MNTINKKINHIDDYNTCIDPKASLVSNRKYNIQDAQISATLLNTERLWIIQYCFHRMIAGH